MSQDCQSVSQILCWSNDMVDRDVLESVFIALGLATL